MATDFPQNPMVSNKRNLGSAEEISYNHDKTLGKKGVVDVIQYVIGRAGSGKTRYVYQQIRDYLQQNPQKRAVLMVPEVFTLQAERELISFLRCDGLLQAEVLSFSRLAHRVLEDVGEEDFQLISPLGKMLLLKKILLEKKEELTVYPRLSGKDGIVQELAVLLDAMKQEGLQPDILRQLAQEQEGTLLNSKFQDLAVLQEALTAYMQGNYLDSEDRLRLVLACIPRCTFLKGTRIWLDGFSRLTTPDRKIIEKLLLTAEKVTVSFTMDLRAGNDREMFEPIIGNWEKLRQRVREAGVREEAPVFLQTPPQMKKAVSLRHLEEQAFAFPYQPYRGSVDNITVYEMDSLYAEAEAAAQKILSWVREKNLRWRDIGLAVFNVQEYAPILERVFADYEIPVFFSVPRSILHQPLVQLLLSTLDMVQKNLRFADVFAFMKTNAGILEPEEYEELENYCLAYGIRGDRWQKPFTAGSPDELERLNGWRERFCAYVQTCFPALQRANNYAEYTRALYDCIDYLQIRTRLLDEVVALQREGKTALASELAQGWGYTMEILEQMIEILGEQPTTLKQYAQVLQTGLAAVEMSLLPSAQDQIVVGDVQQTWLPEVKALWVMGFGDGVLPSAGKSGGILLPSEQELLRERGWELEPDPESRILWEYYHVYRSIAKAQQEIAFSYSMANGNSASLFVEQLKKVFPDMKLVTPTDRGAMPCGSQAVFHLLVEKICGWRDGQPMEKEWQAIYRWYQTMPQWQARLQTIQRALHQKGQVENLSVRQAHRLYERRNVLPLSISRMESYARCPFSQLVQYGLQPQERREFSLRAPDIGEYMHFLLERYGKIARKKKVNWQTIQREECEAILKEVLEEVPEDYGAGVFTSSFSNRYLWKRLNRMFSLSAWMLTCQLKQGDYVPWNYELRFGQNGELPPVEIALEDGQKILLEGRIDRIDICPDEEDPKKVWLRVIDYKTGVKNFALSDLYYGIGIQLVLYAAALLHGWAKSDSRAAKLAGMFFFHTDDPWTDEKNVEERPEGNGFMKQFRLKGPVWDDVEVVKRMDRTLCAGGKSEVLEANLKKDGTFGANTAALSEKEWERLFAYMEYWLAKNGKDMLDGHCEISPAMDGQRMNSCTYCRYRSICQFDMAFEEHRYRLLPKLKESQVLQKMEEALKTGGKEAIFDENGMDGFAAKRD